MKNRLLYFSILLLLAAGFGCSDRSSGPDNKPEPYYKLIYSYVQPPVSVLTFNTRTGGVLDSVWYTQEPFLDVAYSKDCALACYTVSTRSQSGGLFVSTWVADAATGDTAAIDRGHGGGEVILSPDGSHLTMISSQYMVLYTIPNLGVLYEKSATSVFARFRPTKDLLFFIYATPNLGWDTLYVLDYSVTPAVERSVALSDSLGEHFPAAPMEFSGDGRWTLMTYYNWLFLVDTDSLKVRKIMKSLHFADANYTGIRVHPDGQRAFLTYYDPWYKLDVGGLDIFDFSTLTLTNYIDHVTVPGLSRPFRPSRIEFTPDGEEMFGVNFEIFGGADIVKLELAAKAVSQFTAHRGEYHRVLKINPKPFY